MDRKATCIEPEAAEIARLRAERDAAFSGRRRAEAAAGVMREALRYVAERVLLSIGVWATVQRALAPDTGRRAAAVIEAARGMRDPATNEMWAALDMALQALDDNRPGDGDKERP